MTAMNRRQLWMILGLLVVIALLALFYVSADSAPGAIAARAGSSSPLAITAGQKAAILGAEQLLLGADPTSYLFMPQIQK